MIVYFVLTYCTANWITLKLKSIFFFCKLFSEFLFLFFKWLSLLWLYFLVFLIALYLYIFQFSHFDKFRIFILYLKCNTIAYLLLALLLWKLANFWIFNWVCIVQRLHLAPIERWSRVIELIFLLDWNLLYCCNFIDLFTFSLYPLRHETIFI